MWDHPARTLGLGLTYDFSSGNKLTVTGLDAGKTFVLTIYTEAYNSGPYPSVVSHTGFDFVERDTVKRSNRYLYLDGCVCIATDSTITITFSHSGSEFEYLFTICQA